MKIEKNNNKNKEYYLFVWGDNKYGQLGSNITDDDKNEKGNMRKKLDLENINNNLISFDKSNKYFSENKINLIENFSTSKNAPNIIHIFDSKIITKIEVGLYHNLIQTNNGKIYAFGNNLKNQILNVECKLILS
jgi:alpha-tubulin suppressor-like RCC1 family protein